MIRIDHIGIPARGRLDAASFLTRIFGLDRAIPGDGRFAPVQVSSGFTPDFSDAPQFDSANGHVDHPLADRGLYFRTPDGHLFEVMSLASVAGTT